MGHALEMSFDGGSALRPSLKLYGGARDAAEAWISDVGRDGSCASFEPSSVPPIAITSPGKPSRSGRAAVLDSGSPCKMIPAGAAGAADAAASGEAVQPSQTWCPIGSSRWPIGSNKAAEAAARLALGASATICQVGAVSVFAVLGRSMSWRSAIGRLDCSPSGADGPVIRATRKRSRACGSSLRNRSNERGSAKYGFAFSSSSPWASARRPSPASAASTAADRQSRG